jgi:hypothetical protein
MSGRSPEDPVAARGRPTRCPRQSHSTTLERSRAGISLSAQISDEVIRPGLARLSDDLSSSRWHRRHADLLVREALDVGYWLLVRETITFEMGSDHHKAWTPQVTLTREHPWCVRGRSPRPPWN